MSTQSDPSTSDLEGQGVGVLPTSKDCDKNANSRDVNLNSKNFTDCNLLGTTDVNGEMKCDFACSSPSEKTKTESISVSDGRNTTLKENNNLSQPKNDTEFDTLTITSLNETKNIAPPNELAEMKESLLSAGSEVPLLQLDGINGLIAKSEREEHNHSLPNSAVNKATLLTNKEIETKFQDLSFAFKIDSMTIQKRLHLMKRKRDQAESNIEHEIKTINIKLKSLQNLSINSDYVNLLSDVKKELDFILNATIQLSNIAEGYGYAQHEERVLEFVSVMLQHVENVEAAKTETSKILDKLRNDGKRPQNVMSFDSDGEEDKILRRRSMAAMVMEGTSRRRASIATLPRVSSSSSENGSHGKASGSALKKLSFSQGSSSRVHITSSPKLDDSRRDSIGCRHRSESRASDSFMKNIEEQPEQRSPLSDDTLSLEATSDADDSIGGDDSSLHLRQLYETIEEISQDSFSQENVNIIYCLRKILHWNKLLLSSARFRWPDSVFQYLPFYITWYVMFILALIFVGGLLTGINGCYTLILQYSLHWCPLFTSFVMARRFYRILLPLFTILLIAVIFSLLWLTKVILPTLNDKEINELFRSLGLVLEVHYKGGPPPL